MKRYEVTIGQEFHISAVNVKGVEPISAAARAVDGIARSRVRGRLAFLLVVGIAVSLCIAAAVGYFDGSYNEVGEVWKGAGFILGYVLATYFSTGPPSS